MAVPICTEGPSLPSGTPIRKVVNEAINVPRSVVTHLKLIKPRKIPIDAGIPPPLMLGHFL
jgi:hypothetical protein